MLPAPLVPLPYLVNVSVLGVSAWPGWRGKGYIPGSVPTLSGDRDCTGAQRVRAHVGVNKLKKWRRKGDWNAGRMAMG